LRQSKEAGEGKGDRERCTRVREGERVRKGERGGLSEGGGVADI